MLLVALSFELSLEVSLIMSSGEGDLEIEKSSSSDITTSTNEQASNVSSKELGTVEDVLSTSVTSDL